MSSAMTSPAGFMRYADSFAVSPTSRRLPPMIPWKAIATNGTIARLQPTSRFSERRDSIRAAHTAISIPPRLAISTHSTSCERLIGHQFCLSETNVRLARVATSTVTEAGGWDEAWTTTNHVPGGDADARDRVLQQRIGG